MRSLFKALGLSLLMFGNLSCISSGFAQTTGKGTPQYWESNCAKICKEKVYNVTVIEYKTGKVRKQKIAILDIQSATVCECGAKQ